MSGLKRKRFLKGLAATTIALPFAIRACGGEQQAQTTSAPNLRSGKKYRWSMVTTWPPNFPVVGEGCTLFADWVKEMSGGRLEIKVYGGGEKVPPLEVFDTVKNGAAEMGSGASYYWMGKLPSAPFFAAVPFGMNAQQLNSWMLCGDGLKLWRELYAGHNLIPFVGGNTGVQMGGWFNREINSPADLQGLQMRMPGLGASVLEKAGGTSVLLPGSDIYTGLERGVIEATEWIGPYHDYLMGFHQIAKYYYMPGWHETSAALELIVNKEKFEELPKDLQAIIQTASHRLNGWMLAEFEAKNSIYLKKLVEEENVQLRQYPKEVIEQLKIYTKEVLEEVAEKDSFAKKVYTNYRKFKERATFWSNSSERLYYGELS